MASWKSEQRGGALAVRNETSARVVADAVTMADTAVRRAVGLLRHSRLEAGAGLWIKPCSGVHTFGMSFPIDVIGLDKQMRIVKLWPELKPNRMTAIYPRVRTVLELAAGTIASHNVSIGDQLTVEQVADRCEAFAN